SIVGRHAQRRASVPRVRDAPRDLSGPRDHGRGPRLQPARRRIARRAGPAAPMRIVHATLRHVPPLARLMAASPLLRRYRVTERGARRNLLSALRARDILLTAVEGDAVVGLAGRVPNPTLGRGAAPPPRP